MALSINPSIPLNSDEQPVLADIRNLIEGARQKVAISANAAITILYWHIG